MSERRYRCIGCGRVSAVDIDVCPRCHGTIFKHIVLPGDFDL